MYPKDIYRNGILNSGLVWESADTSVAMVENGRVIAVADGETDIIVRSADVGRTTFCHVCVSGLTLEVPDVGGVVYAYSPFGLKIGERLMLPPPSCEGRVVWRSENRYVIDVDENGVVWACSRHVRQEVDESGLFVTELPEPVRIYATAVEGGVVYGYEIRIQEETEDSFKKRDCFQAKKKEMAAVSYMGIPKEVEIEVDQVWQIPLELPEAVSCYNICWLCTDIFVATVDREGVVQGYHAGTCLVYAIAVETVPEQERGKLEAWKTRRWMERDNEDFCRFLEGTLYAWCRLSVRDVSPCLRNLHVVEEAITSDSILLLWNRAALSDIPEFSQYQVFCNDEKVAETGKLGYRAEHLAASTEYRFRVVALDKRGGVLTEVETLAMTKQASAVLNVLDFGAWGDGRHMDTLLLQNVIDQCPEGGIVLLPERHVFVSGALFLKSNMTFQVDGILLGSSNPKDYPRVSTRWEGWRKLEQPPEDWENSTAKVPANHCTYASLLNAGCYDEGEWGSMGPYNVENLIICGKGQINGNSFSLSYNEGPNGNAVKLVSKEYPVKDATLRGSAIRIHNGRHIYIKDVQAAYAPGWTVHVIYCSHITFDGMEIVSQGDGDCGFGTDILHRGHVYNGDGIDPDSCVHVNVFNCFFTTGDDAVAIKSGRNREGNEVDKPSAYIRVTDCTSDYSLGGFGIGSESSGGVHDILFQNLKINHALVSGIWIKTNRQRGGIVEHIQVRDLKVAGCNSPVWVHNGYSSTSVIANPSKTLPIVRQLTFENIDGSEENEMGIRITGTPDIPVTDVRFRNISIGGRENQLDYCECAFLE